MNTISIALCTYNGATYLRQQLISLANQTHKPDEVIICDDASNDDSLVIAENFAQQHNLNIHIYRNSHNLGYVRNFEKAISLCTKNLIFLCDQDDLWHPQKIEMLVEIFNNDQNVGLILHDFSWIDESNAPYPNPNETYGAMKIKSNLLPQEIKNNSISVFMEPYPRAWCGCMMAYRSKFNNVVLPIFPGKGHDDWILKVIAPITETRFIAKPLIQYRMHQKNTNRRDLEKRTLSYLFGRFINKSSLLLKGYTKRNFYKNVIERLIKSDYQIRHANLIKLYKKFAN